MDERSELFSFDSASRFFKKNYLILFLISGGILLLIIGIFQFISDGNKGNDGIEFVTNNEEKTGEIMVDVSGAVKNPGVYKLKSKQRISDAIEASGGYSEDANEEYISRNMNLAQKLTDGMKIYIPKEGEESGGVLGETSIENSGLININSASQSKLEELPRVGPVTAEKIIDGRPYDSINDLLIKKVVGASAFDQIKDLITAP